MSTLLVPYNNAMRLGHGYNSYTQQLCINDAVKKADKVPATEDDLKSEPASYGVSQVVTYTSKYVTKVSDVTDALNVSGALEIKLTAINASGSAKASFIDTQKFKESDLNFMIQVRVINNKLVAEDVTEFDPIDGVAEADFTNVYGDSYISGFVEGGEFTGLISIKLADRSKAQEIQAGASLSGNLPGGIGEASGNADIKINKDLADAKGETTISVSWTGGGDVKGSEITTWTTDTLEKAAVSFAEKVAVTPQRIYAIVTKYTALRSFHALKKKGTPLDYENAGVYTGELLDAFLDYRVMWKELRITSEDLQRNAITLKITSKTPLMAHYAQELKDNYDKQLQAYNASVAQPVATPSTDSGASGGAPLSHSSGFAGQMPQCCKPLQPNHVEPYTADIFGLESARRDCRFEMIKIAQEIDAVTIDPKVALDSSRKWQYLSPIVFQMLIPVSAYLLFWISILYLSLTTMDSDIDERAQNR
jgi:hypothetical protein